MNTSPDNALIRQVVFIAMAPAIGLGIARFAYALLLPEMRSELHWTYSQAGWMNTINAAGYLIGALLTAPLTKHFSLIKLLQAGVIVSVIALPITGLTGNFAALSFLRLLVGISGAFCFVAGGAIGASLATRSVNRSGLILSLFYAGPGVGIALSGSMVPFYIERFGSTAWGAAWLVLGALALVLAVMFFKADTSQISSGAQSSTDLSSFKLMQNIPVLIGYMAFGAGYIGYMTFMFTYLKQSGASTAQLAAFWATIGVTSMMSPWLWGYVITRLRRGFAISLLTFITLFGAAIPLASTSSSMVLVSAAIFGAAFFSVPAATTAFAKRNAAVSEWPYVIGVFTAAFGAGQVIGPVLSGIISDNTGSLSNGLIWGCFFLGAGVVLPLFQKDQLAH